MTALFVKIFAERNCGGAQVGRDIRRGFATSLMRGMPEIDRAALRELLKTVPPRERADLHNQLLDMEHDRILYSDFGWSGTAPSLDIIQSAAHAADTLFVGLTMHPAGFATALMDKPRTPGAQAPEMPLMDWLTRPFPVHRRDGLDDDAARPPLALWSAKARALLELADTDRAVMLLRAEDVAQTAIAGLSAHLPVKSGTTPAIEPPELPDWQPVLRRVPARMLREFRLQLDAGVLKALGYDPL